ncbi:MAG: proline--tRNA ligase [Legionellales bacterium]|nr:proline--tRNA ligase [Legionellales bacterium]
MRTSRFPLATVKETPADAEVISHQLMLRAGLIRKLSSGLYTWMPIGLRVLKKVEAIIREEMNNAGALEILMPTIQPAELWQESGRWQEYGPHLLKMKDRHQRDFCYGPTHEEVVTDLMRQELKSYKQLPITVYQVQAKFRDEVRPRFGIMRAREFLMKDAYSFDLDKQGMQVSYQKMYDAYCAIFTRLGLLFRPVLADTGSIGGSFSHEFQVLADSGEDLIAYSDGSDYTANIELAESLAPGNPPSPSKTPKELIDTPTQQTIVEVTQFLGVKPEQTVKVLIVKGKTTPLVALVLRGDHELNTIKAEKLPEVAIPLQFAEPELILQQLNCSIGFIGPIGLAEQGIPVIADRDAAHLTDFICGANLVGKHFKHVDWTRDCSPPQVIDIRNVKEGDLSPDGKGQLHLRRGIEVGHVFQLGDKYSQAMGATVLNDQGQSISLQMGCYGIGVSRIVAAAIEQHHDEHGILWPATMAPFDLCIVPINLHRSEAVKAATESLYEALQAKGLAVLLDDRQERPGVMFADMDLIGIPYRVVISERGLAEGKFECKNRKTGEVSQLTQEEIFALLQNVEMTTNM